MSIILRSVAIFILLSWQIYWMMMAKRSKKEKPENVVSHKSALFETFITRFLKLFVFLQLIGLSIFSFPDSIFVQIIGVVFIFIGVILCVFARKALDTNWTAGQVYQVKKHHTLITTGIYRFVRHPIYLGIFFSYIGGELVAQSYLVFVFLVILLFANYYAAKREEKLLLSHFGRAYAHYIQKSKMIIPFVF